MTDAPASKSKPAPRLAAIFAAVAIASPLVVASEGWVRKTSPDPIGIPTACAGVTSGVVSGKTYTDDECVAMTAQALLKHGLEIDKCLTVPLSDKTRGAFLSFAYNVGTSAFCSSTLARKANAGDLAGACAEMSKWTFAGGKQLPGLVRRRSAERALCEAGIAPASTVAAKPAPPPPPPSSAVTRDAVSAGPQPGFLGRLLHRFA